MDLISRQAAIEAVKSEKVKVFHELYDEAWNDAINGCIDVIEQLLPAEPKTGRWIIDRSGAYCCSECMEPCAGYVMMKPRDKFCKMCGAKMEVTECIERPKSLGFDRRPEWPFGGDET